jgi:hypothetical protein
MAVLSLEQDPACAPETVVDKSPQSIVSIDVSSTERLLKIKRYLSTMPDADYSGDFDPDPGHDFDDVTLQLYGTHTPAAEDQPDASTFLCSRAGVFESPGNKWLRGEKSD